VEYVVGFGGVPQPIPDAEIAAIETVTSSGLSAQPWPFLKAGYTVRIGFGCLAGLEGMLVRTLGADRLVLSVEILQRSIAVELDRSWVRPAAVTTSATA
jgi:transcription antitermination factor NusG